nr:PadR family transcriptional regulator [uncultured Gemmiger sp.]
MQRKRVVTMPRERFKTLTEQMFYLLLCLREECRGMEILEKVRQMTGGRVSIGSGTLYDLLEQFTAEGWIEATGTLRGRRRYRITEKGAAMLAKEYDRLQQQIKDYERYAGKEAQP